MPNTVRTVADILNLPAWPSEQLRLIVERWQPAAEVRIERTGVSGQVSIGFEGRYDCARIFWGRRKARRPRHRFGCVPTLTRARRTALVRSRLARDRDLLFAEHLFASASAT